MSKNVPVESGDLGSGDDVPATIAPPPRPFSPIDTTYQGASDAETGTAIFVPDRADENLTRQLRGPELSNIVSWESDTDPLNPMNWSNTKRWANTGVISVMTFST